MRGVGEANSLVTLKGRWRKEDWRGPEADTARPLVSSLALSWYRTGFRLAHDRPGALSLFNQSILHFCLVRCLGRELLIWDPRFGLARASLKVAMVPRRTQLDFGSNTLVSRLYRHLT
jgi:hypothetical protein